MLILYSCTASILEFLRALRESNMSLDCKCCKFLTNSAKHLHTDVVLPKRMPLLGGLQEWWDHVYCCPEHRAIHVCHTIFPSSVDLHSWQSWAEDDLTRWGCAAYGLWTTSCAQHARIGRWHFAGQAVGLATMLQPQDSISPCLILPLVSFGLFSALCNCDRTFTRSAKMWHDLALQLRRQSLSSQSFRSCGCWKTPHFWKRPKPCGVARLQNSLTSMVSVSIDHYINT